MFDIEKFAAELREEAGSDDYRAKLRAGLTLVMFAAGWTVQDGQRVTMVMSGEASEELITTLAFILHSSEECSSPTKVRRVCDELASKLRRRINDARAQAAEGNLDWLQTMTVPDKPQ